MASYHCSIKPVSRATGRSAAGAAAYRAGERLTDERTGEVHDYTRKRGVDFSQLVLPEGVSVDRQKIWSMAEAAEKRKDARVAREYELALPSELPPEARQKLAVDFARGLVKLYGVAADVSIHAPGRHGDQRNHHAHIMTTTRQITPQGLTDKADIERKDDDLRKLGRRPAAEQIGKLREAWANMCNRALERIGSPERVSHKSLKAQGHDRPATVHLGPACSAMERRGIDTVRGTLNREITAEQARQDMAQKRAKMALESPERGQPTLAPAPTPKAPPAPPEWARKMAEKRAADEARQAATEKREQAERQKWEEEKRLNAAGVQGKNAADVRNIIATTRDKLERYANRLDKSMQNLEKHDAEVAAMNPVKRALINHHKTRDELIEEQRNCIIRRDEHKEYLSKLDDAYPILAERERQQREAAAQFRQRMEAQAKERVKQRQQAQPEKKREQDRERER